MAALKSLSQVPSEHLVPVLSRVIIKKDPVSPPNWGVNRFFLRNLPVEQFGVYPARFAFGCLFPEGKRKDNLAVEYKSFIRLVIAKSRKI